jgi:hypothetical protein
MDAEQELWSGVYRDELGRGRTADEAKRAADKALGHFREAFPRSHGTPVTIDPPMLDPGVIIKNVPGIKPLPVTIGAALGVHGRKQRFLCELDLDGLSSLDIEDK